MYGRKVKLRFFYIFIIFLILSLTIFLTLKSLEENVIYFQSPTDVKALAEIDKKIPAVTASGEIFVRKEKEVKFVGTDFKNEINVIYSGLIPNLFAEGKGVVAEGFLKDKSLFLATKILAKHDENYMPPEVKAALEEK